MSDKKRTILLVEDEVIIALATKESLQDYGYEVITVHTGEEAIHAVEHNPGIELVLMDIDLGQGIDGPEATELMLKKRDLPVVFLSSHVEPEIVEKTEKATSYGYVVKDSNITVLDASIKMAFKLFEARLNEKRASNKATSILKTIPEILFRISRDGQFLDILTDDESRLFSSWDSAAGKNISDFMSEQTTTMAMEAIANALKTNEVKTFTYELTMPSGQSWYEARISRLNDDEVLAMIIDITERKKIEETLIEDRKWLDYILEVTRTGLDILDADLNLRYVDNGWQKIYGDPQGRKCYDYFMGRTTPCPTCGVPRAMESKEIVVTEEFLPKENRNIMVHTIPFQNANGEWLVAEFNIDITERKRAEEEIKLQLVEKETLLKEVHHRIKNNFATVASLLSLQVQSTTEAEVKNALQDSISRVQSMRILYDKLLLRDDYNEVSVKNYIESLVASIITVFPKTINITITTRITDFNLISKKLFHLGVIINELLTNIMKYSFIGRMSGHVSISLDKHDNHVTLVVQDDGNGLLETFNLNTSTGFGLKLVGMLSKQLGGTYRLENNNGARSVLKFDI